MAYRNFTVWKDLYDLKYDMYKTDFVTLKSGLTILSGCNGAGKFISDSAITTRIRETGYYESYL